MAACICACFRLRIRHQQRVYRPACSCKMLLHWSDTFLIDKTRENIACSRRIWAAPGHLGRPALLNFLTPTAWMPAKLKEKMSDGSIQSGYKSGISRMASPKGTCFSLMLPGESTQSVGIWGALAGEVP